MESLKFQVQGHKKIETEISRGILTLQEMHQAAEAY